MSTRVISRIGCLILSVFPVLGIAAGPSVTITPPTPIAGKTFTIEVNGGFSDSCWRISSKSIVVTGSRIDIDIQTTDLSDSTTFCPQTAITYSRIFEVGPFPEGEYLVTVTEHHSSLRNPQSSSGGQFFKIVQEPPSCIGRVGNVNCDTFEIVDITDITTLIDHLFISLAPLGCPAEANVDRDPFGVIDITDLTYLISSLLILNTAPPLCPDFIVYDYTGFDAFLRPVVIGSLSYTIQPDSTLSGNWNHRALNDSIVLGPQVGRGVLIGTIRTGWLSIDLGGGGADYNVYLDGQATQTGWFGRWEFHTIEGVVAEGPFELRRRF